MARALVLDYDGECSELPLTKIDRSRLYGSRKRVVVDESGTECQSAWLCSDGRTIVPAGGTSMVYLDDRGGSIPRSDLIVVDADGDDCDRLPSTLGTPVELSGPVPVDRVLDHQARSVYLLDASAIGDRLRDELAAGHIFETEFRYTASPTTHTLFLLQNDAGTFGLVCEPIDLPFIAPDTMDEADDDEDPLDDDDDLDFSF